MAKHSVTDGQRSEINKINAKLSDEERNQITLATMDDHYKFPIYACIKQVKINGKQYKGYIELRTYENNPNMACVIIAIDKEARKSGLSERLMNTMLSIIDNPESDYDVNLLICRCDIHNKPAIKLAKKYQFKQVFSNSQHVELKRFVTYSK